MAKYRIVRIKGHTHLHRVEKLMFVLFGHEFWRSISSEWLSLKEAETWIEFEQFSERRKKEGQEMTPHDTVVKVYE